MAEYFIHETGIVDDGAKIGKGTKIWHFSHVQKNAVIGEGCSLGQNVNVGENAVIGNHVKIQNNVSVYGGVVLEDYVFCGPSMVFTNDLTPRAKYPKGSANYQKTIIRWGATIGANATVVCGITIGRNAMIGAGAVITKNIPPHVLVSGVPAREMGYVCECGTVLKDGLTCPECGRKYRKITSGEDAGGLEEITE